MSTVISTPISSIRRNGPIGIPHCKSASSISCAADAIFEKFRSFEQIRKEDAVNEEPGTVAHNHWQLGDLAHKTERAGNGGVRGFRSDHNFDQFHSTDWIKEMQSDDALGRFGFGCEIGNWQGGSVRGQHRGMRRLLRRDRGRSVF